MLATLNSLNRSLRMVMSWLVLTQFCNPIEKTTVVGLGSGCGSAFKSSVKCRICASGKLSICMSLSCRGGMFDRFESPKNTTELRMVMAQSAFLRWVSLWQTGSQ